MSTLVIPGIPLDADSPAQRLRRMAAAVRLSFTWWGIHRTLTDQQKQEVGGAYGADVRLLTAGKKLVDTRCESFRKLTSLRSRASSYWRGLTLPYVESGIRLIRQSDIAAFVHTMEGFRQELNDAETDLETDFAQIKSNARERLGRLFDAADYPRDVRGLFAVSWEFPNVEPPRYLAQISPEVYEEERRRVAARFDEAVRLAEQAFATEFARLLAHLTERLTDDGERRVFRDSAVNNLREFFDRFQHLNVRSNPDLDALVTQAQGLVQGVAPQQLRDDDALRRQVTSAMTRVQSQVERLIVDAPRRRVIRAQSTENGGAHAVDS